MIRVTLMAPETPYSVLTLAEPSDFAVRDECADSLREGLAPSRLKRVALRAIAWIPQIPFWAPLHIPLDGFLSGIMKTRSRLLWRRWEDGPDVLFCHGFCREYKHLHFIASSRREHKYP
jgi:hypothetical protein